MLNWQIDGLETVQMGLLYIERMFSNIAPKIMQDIVTQGVTHAKECVPRDTGALENSVEGEIAVTKVGIDGLIGIGGDNINLKSGNPTRDYAEVVNDGSKNKYGKKKGGPKFAERTQNYIEKHMKARMGGALRRILT
jgi:hypothetical protein